jgi:hypothetical protein
MPLLGNQKVERPTVTANMTFGSWPAYPVSRRTAEIGVRVALGADRQAVIGMVLGQGPRLDLAGVAVGLAVALASSVPR